MYAILSEFLTTLRAHFQENLLILTGKQNTSNAFRGTGVSAHHNQTMIYLP